MLTSASSMMQSEKLESLLCCFLHGAPHYHHKTTEGRPLVTKGAKSPWMRAFASAENKSRLRSWGGLFLLHTSWLAGVQARTPAVCVPANTILGSLLGDPEFRLYTQSDKGFFFPPLQTIAREMNSHQAHIWSGIWKTQFRAFDETATGYFSCSS